MAIRNLRDYVEACEAIGELKRVKAEVDWNLELSHVAKLVADRNGPALLFEKVKDCWGSALINIFWKGERLAVIMDLPTHYSLCQMAREWMDRSRTRELVRSVEVDSGPVRGNAIEEKDIDLTKLPVPKFFPLDGGRFLGTSAVRVIRDPETGLVDIALNRMQLLDEKRFTMWLIKGRGGDQMRRKYAQRGEKMPFAVILGCDPMIVLTAVLYIRETSKYDIAGTIRGAPVELVKSDLYGLPVPAEAELVIEGELDPVVEVPDGPFPDLTGYYTVEIHTPDPKPFVTAQRISYRDDPISMFSLAGGGPGVNDVQMMMLLTRTAALWEQLEAMGIPGIKSVFIPPEFMRFWVVVSVKTMYPGHSNQVAAAVMGTEIGHHGVKGVIIVDDDVAADDMEKVLWSLGARYDPLRDTDIIKRGRATATDTAFPPEIGHPEITSKIVMDATIPFEWPNKPVMSSLDEEVVKKVKARWPEYGID